MMKLLLLLASFWIQRVCIEVVLGLSVRHPTLGKLGALDW